MSLSVTPSQLQSLRDCLLNSSGSVPLHERFRALFTLKAVGGPDVVEIIASGFSDPSPLLKHELAYVLGQISHPSAIPYLEDVLVDAKDFHGEMVRHEAAEALGALSSEGSLGLLRKYLGDGSRSVRETCEISIAKIEWDHSEEGKARAKDPNFPTIDPAPSSSLLESESLPSLRASMLSTKLPLFERYRAMFALRNRAAGGEKDAVKALAEGFGDGSALFRHEIAYIFGQLSSPHSIPSLLHVLRDSEEDEMVRHEAAEALGGIASEGSEDEPGLSKEELFPDQEDRRKGVLGILREWSGMEGAPIVVKESCQVAVDMWEYENSNQFQYADKLVSGDEVADEKQGARLTGMDRGAAALVGH